MKNLFGTLALISALATTAEASSLYSFQFNADHYPGPVTGSFIGTANGNLITDLSDIRVSLNGEAFQGSGNLWGSSFGWISGGAVASFDGLQNNFMFIDCDFPNDYSYTNFFYFVSGMHQRDSYGIHVSGHGEAASLVDYGVTSSATWGVHGVALTEPSAVVLFGLGLLSLLGFCRKRV